MHTSAYNYADGTNDLVGAALHAVPPLDSAFHIYALEWSERRLAASVDGVPYFVFERVPFSIQ